MLEYRLGVVVEDSTRLQLKLVKLSLTLNKTDKYEHKAMRIRRDWNHINANYNFILRFNNFLIRSCTK